MPMADSWNEKDASEVAVDLSTLKGEPSAADTLYTVSIRGTFDDHWVEGFRLAQGESAVYRRFEFQRATGAVRFTCRTVDGTGLVFEMLERLEALVARAGQLATIWRSQGPRISLSPARLPAR